MYSRSIVPLIVILGVVAGTVGGFLLFSKGEQQRYAAVRRVEQQPSDIRLSMTTSHLAGPIAEETLRMENRDGLSSEEYSVIGRKGLVVRVHSNPRPTHDVSFFFESAVVDGIWELRDRPVRSDDPTRYAIDVYQLVNGEHGSHAFAFSHPHYWATTGGHQFKIHLDKNKPLPDLLHISSTTTVEPRYEKLVKMFDAYGTAQFRAKAAEARARVIRHNG